MSTTATMTFLDYANHYQNNASSWMQLNITGNQKMPRKSSNLNFLALIIFFRKKNWDNFLLKLSEPFKRALRLVKRLKTKFIRGVNRSQNFGCVSSKLGNFNRTPKGIKQNGLFELNLLRNDKNLVVDPFLEILKKFSASRCRGWPKYEGILSRIERILQISS